MPISLQERMTLRAISPRFATSIFLNIFLVASPYFEAARYCACASRRARIRSAHGLSRADREKPFAVLDRLTVFHQDTDDLTRHLRFDFVHQFHCLDDADNGILGTDTEFLVVREFGVCPQNYFRISHAACLSS